MATGLVDPKKVNALPGSESGVTEFLIGTTTSTVGSGTSGPTQINYVPRVKTDGLAS